MKCWVLLVNRGRGVIYRRCTYEASTGKIRRVLFWKILQFQIPDKAEPIEIELKRGKTKPLWIVNEKTLTALSIHSYDFNLDLSGLPKTVKIPKNMPHPDSIVLEEKTDTDADIKLNVLGKKAFWEGLGGKLKLSFWEILIYLFAGMGIMLLIQYVLGVVMHR